MVDKWVREGFKRRRSRWMPAASFHRLLWCKAPRITREGIQTAKKQSKDVKVWQLLKVHPLSKNRNKRCLKSENFSNTKLLVAEILPLLRQTIIKRKLFTSIGSVPLRLESFLFRMIRAPRFTCKGQERKRTWWFLGPSTISYREKLSTRCLCSRYTRLPAPCHSVKRLSMRKVTILS
jgi:hypothetical protein